MDAEKMIQDLHRPFCGSFSRKAEAILYTI